MSTLIKGGTVITAIDTVDADVRIEGEIVTGIAAPGTHDWEASADEVIDATELCDSEELTRLRAHLDQQLSSLQGLITRLANRLQRQLLARQTRSARMHTRNRAGGSRGDCTSTR